MTVVVVLCDERREKTTRGNRKKETTARWPVIIIIISGLMRFILISNAGEKKMAALAVCVLRSRMREIGDARFTIAQHAEPPPIFFFSSSCGRLGAIIRSIKQQHPKMIYTAAHLTIESTHAEMLEIIYKEMYIFFCVCACVECFLFFSVVSKHHTEAIVYTVNGRAGL